MLSSFCRHFIITSAKKLKGKDIRAMNSMSTLSNRLIWLDLEMTGLNLETDQILEIGCLVTDENLNHLDEGIEVVIHQPDHILNNMNTWCIEQHGKSGLTAASRASDVSLEAAELKVVSYVTKHTEKGKCPLAGNTVHEDRRFLIKYMPHLVEQFHYRIVDVSTVKELCRRWYSSEYERCPSKSLAHRSLGDIKESIDELKYYWSNIFKQ